MAVHLTPAQVVSQRLVVGVEDGPCVEGGNHLQRFFRAKKVPPKMYVSRSEKADYVSHDLGGPPAVQSGVFSQHEAELVALPVGQKNVGQIVHHLTSTRNHLKWKIVSNSINHVSFSILS